MDYVLDQHHKPNACEVKYIGLGAGMASIVATLNGHRFPTLNLSLTKHFVLPQQQKGEHSLCSHAQDQLCVIAMQLSSIVSRCENQKKQ